MKLAQRLKCYRAIESLRQRPLIAYATSTRPNVFAMIAQDAIGEFIDQIELVDGKHTAIDVLLHSNGGDPMTAWRLLSLLRERFDTVGVLVPLSAFSAATLFSMGADEIFMHPNACLGPIDPQMKVVSGDGKQIGFGYEDVSSFLKFITKECKFTEASEVAVAMDKLFATVDPLAVGAAKRASDLSSDVGGRLLQMHMGDRQKSRAKRIAENLNKSFFNHADAISRERARKLGLPVSKPDTKLEQRLWAAFRAIEEYMDLRRPFTPLEVFLADPVAAQSLEPMSPLQVPPNMPPQLIQNMWNLAAQQALQAMQSGTAPSVEVDVVNALIESPRRAREFRTKNVVHAVRLGLQAQVSVTTKQQGWGDSPDDLPTAPVKETPPAIRSDTEGEPPDVRELNPAG